MFWPCETKTSTCRSFATISSDLYRFLAITVLLGVKDIPQVGPLQWGRISARLVGQRLSERLGQQFVVENWPGAAGNLATEAVVRAPPDGYTLLLANGANAVSATLYEKLSFDFIRDIAPVASIAGAALVMVTNLLFPAKTVPEFIAYAKANPGKINMAVAGGGASTPFLAGELFKGMTGVEWVWVQYRGEYMPDLISG